MAAICLGVNVMIYLCICSIVLWACDRSLIWHLTWPKTNLSIRIEIKQRVFPLPLLNWGSALLLLMWYLLNTKRLGIRIYIIQHTCVLQRLMWGFSAVLFICLPCIKSSGDTWQHNFAYVDWSASTLFVCYLPIMFLNSGTEYQATTTGSYSLINKGKCYGTVAAQ